MSVVKDNMDDDLDSLLFVEEKFHREGFQEGLNFGREAAGQEAHMYGMAKGDQLASELGFYRGFASMWGALLNEGEACGNSSPMPRAGKVLTAFQAQLDEIDTTIAITPHNTDLPKLFARLRTKFRQCTTLLKVDQNHRSAAPPHFIRLADDAGY
ncbi:hypothetical protein SARC_05181 [Sphaeroforma arctica JP610]|uniref:Essential protein Yae1 N-terminal domain-containing protein n=1 Tax=Sphaeroforma arctica JP610 TaxID=667725 RepID=A0A0L0G2W3_9EUKA|nr:hypothetical protein SARC_05181 [Sphaeroforma arctica JP610]KNC82533.1 hypothetical protein SARC_05181 [Sphaeroforma arctica JP610]|eukprot:XP_014156435.1 hypothetical protein SARC_05181 [Sphaeroforma arctica JP610]